MSNVITKKKSVTHFVALLFYLSLNSFSTNFYVSEYKMSINLEAISFVDSVQNLLTANLFKLYWGMCVTCGSHITFNNTVEKGLLYWNAILIQFLPSESYFCILELKSRKNHIEFFHLNNSNWFNFAILQLNSWKIVLLQ